MTSSKAFAPAAALFAVVALGACSSSRPGASEDDSVSWSRASGIIDGALSDPRNGHALWGVSIVDLSAGNVLYSRNADRNMIPASNTKLYTTAAALDQLGPDYVFETIVATPGDIRNDTLFGDVFVRGSGDPSVGGRFNDGDELATFRNWAQTLRERGVTHIAGNIIGDDNLFDDVPLGYGWSWDDEPYWYSAELSALSFNDNCIDVTVQATRVGQPAVVSWRPLNTSYVEIKNETLTVESDSLAEERFARKRANNTIYVRTAVQMGTTRSESLSITNPTSFFVHVMRDVFELEGISVNGFALDIDDTDLSPDYGKAAVLIRHRSEPLSEIVRVVNKRSQNLYADQLLKVLGSTRGVPPSAPSALGAEPPNAKEEPRPGSADAGILAAATTWTRAGVDTSIVQIVDGSGLSRYNLLTPESSTKLLTYMWARPAPIREAFVESLPVGGVDGTLSGRYSVGRARGVVKAKTGTVSNVSSLSGYVRTARGTPLAFSLMCNNFVVDTDEIRDVQDLIVNTLASIRDR